MVGELCVCDRCGETFMRRSNRGPKPKYCPTGCKRRAGFERREELGTLLDHADAMASAVAALRSAFVSVEEYQTLRAAIAVPRPKDADDHHEVA